MTEKKNELTLGLALLIILGTAVIMCVSIIFWGLDAHIPLMFSIILAALFGLSRGYKWKDIFDGISMGIKEAIEPVIILALVGLIIGTWILSGTVPTLIFYGLKLMSPQIFLFATTIVCAIVSTMTGSAWGTAGTVGVAFMGIGQGLGIPAPWVAGSVLTGAYFGDKMSPMSDTTILASAIAGSDIWDHIKSMFWTTIPGFTIALIVFLILGFKHTGNDIDSENINLILNGLSSQFNINILLLLPAIFVIGMAVKKQPAIPTLMMGAIFAGILAMIFQDGVTVKDVLAAMHYGYKSDTGVQIIDKLLSKGGLNSMMWSISLILVALSFGGTLQKLKVMDIIIDKMIRYLQSIRSLITANIFMSLLGNMLMGTQYMGIIIPGKNVSEGL